MPKIRHIYHSVRKSPRLTLGVAAAAAVATAGIATAATAGSAPTVSAASNLSAATRTAPGHSGGHATGGHATGGSSGGGHADGQGHPARAAAHHATAAHHAPASHARPVHRAKPAHSAARHAAPARKPYLIYDSVTPSALPHHHVIATYATGSYAASRSQVAGRNVLWIDTNGSAPKSASVLDVEPGDATPSQAATWARQRLTADPNGLARIYTMRSEWPAAKAAIATLPAKMRSHVRWWIADPTGVPHIVPGSQATQWYWGSSYDISTATPKFG